MLNSRGALVLRSQPPSSSAASKKLPAFGVFCGVAQLTLASQTQPCVILSPFTARALNLREETLDGGRFTRRRGDRGGFEEPAFLLSATSAHPRVQGDLKYAASTRSSTPD